VTVMPHEGVTIRQLFYDITPVAIDQLIVDAFRFTVSNPTLTV